MTEITVMLIITANPYEFNERSSEQFLCIAQAGKSEFNTLKDFIQECPEFPLKNLNGINAISFSEIKRAKVTDNLKAFADLTLPPNANVYIVADEWDKFMMVANFQSTFAWYHWCTNA